MNLRLKKIAVKKATRTTLEGSSIHAIPNIVRNKYLAIKLVWTLCFLVSSAYCAYFICNAVSKYYQREVVSRINVKSEPRLPFPIVSICDMDNARRKVNMRWYDMILSCRFGQYICDFENDFVYSFNPKYGNCFIFNSGKNATGDSVPFKYVNDNIDKNDLELSLFIAF